MFLTEKLVNELAVKPYKFEHISLSSFGVDQPLYKRMDLVTIQIMSGLVLLTQNPSTVVNFLHIEAGHEEEEVNLQRFWQVEDTAITPEGNSSKQFLKLYRISHISRQEDGTYSAEFPLKDSYPTLPDKFIVCQKCTRSLAHQLKNS